MNTEIDQIRVNRARNMLDFQTYFAKFLAQTERWMPFCFIADHLFGVGRPVSILETGGLRDPGNWAGDGNSTMVWDFIANKTGGHVISVDIDPKCKEKTLAYCSKNVTPITMDSREYLSTWNARNFLKWDLLYLDSYDFDGSMDAALHHACELGMIYCHLPPGCLIAVDDCHGPGRGKHVLIKEFFKRQDINPVYDGYVTVWKKP